MFLRALVTALCRSCLDSCGKKFDINLFLKRFSILKRFVKNDPAYELETLKSVQALDHKLKHLPGNISQPLLKISKFKPFYFFFN